MPRSVQIELSLPPSIPEKYRSAVQRAVENCKVKKTIAALPGFEVVLRDAAADAAA